MKKLLLAALTLSLSAMHGNAQDTLSANAPQRKHFRGGNKDDKAERKEVLKDLNLTDAQKADLKANRQEMKTQMQAIDKDMSLTEAQKTEKKHGLKKQMKSESKEILTPEQQAKMRAAKKANHGEHGKRLADMKEELALSDEQVSQLKALEVSQHTKMKSIRDAKLADEEKQKQLEELRKSTMEKQKAVLSPDQIRKLHELRKSKKKQIS